MALHLHAVARQVDGQPWLSDIELDLQPGRLHVLYGRTLSGKTSLLRLMAGLDRPSSGQILVDDRDAATLSLQQRQVAFVYEQFVNYPSFTVAQNIAAPLRRAGCGKAECHARVQQVAQLLRIGHLLDRLPAQLSGGQQQRVAIARALAKDARLLLLDEPLVNLDYKLREELRSELRQLFGHGSDRIVVYTTTDPLEAMQLAGDDGEVVVLHEGRVLQRGSAAEVWHRPASDTVARLFADPPMNIVDVTVADGALHLGSLVLPLPAHMAAAPAGPARIGQRAADLRFGHHITPHSVAGEVTLSEVNGAETVLHVQGGHQHWTLQIDGAHPMASGTPLAVHLAPQQMLLFDAAGRLLATPPRPGSNAHHTQAGHPARRH